MSKEDLKYKVGDVVLIKGVITKVNSSTSGHIPLYPYVTEIDSDDPARKWGESFSEGCIVGTMDDILGDKEAEYYKQGTQDVWEMIRYADSVLSLRDRINIFGYSGMSKILELPVEEALNKFKDWKENCLCAPGDIVELTATDGDDKVRAIFCSEVDDEYVVLITGGPCDPDNQPIVPMRLLKRLWTIRKLPGRHVAILEALKDSEEVKED